MVQYRLNIETESRIRWKVYVRFGGEHLEIAHVHMIRRRVLSLRYHLACFSGVFQLEMLLHSLLIGERCIASYPHLIT